MTDPVHRAVFLSYASQDAEPARRICEALRAAGVEVWFDADGGLEHGDEWDAKIRRQIKECVLFLPIISANTQARLEGYFRIEWELAAQRALGIASGVPFILPVVIDGTREPDALVPDRFRTVQWTRLPGGEMTPEVKARYLKLWSHRIGAAKHEAGLAQQRTPGSILDPGDNGVPRASQQSRRALRWAAAAGGVCALAALAVWWKQASVRPPSPAPVGIAAAGVGRITAEVPQSRQLVAQARPLYEDIPGGNLTRQDFAVAEQLLKRALELAPLDGEVWAAYSMLCGSLVDNSLDPTPAREAERRMAAEKAVKLAPESGEAWIALANGYRRQPATRAEGIRILQEWKPKMPGNVRLGVVLALALHADGRREEAMSVLDELPDDTVLKWTTRANLLTAANRPVESAAARQRALALAPNSGPLLLNKANIELRLGEVAEARATLAQVPSKFLLEDIGSHVASWIWLWSGEPEQCLGILRAVPRDFIGGNPPVPKTYLTGLAHVAAGRPEAARAEWRTALGLVEQRLAREGNEANLLQLRARLLAMTGQAAEAEKALQLATEISGRTGDRGLTACVHAWLGRLDQAVALLEARPSLLPELRHSPVWLPLREHPGFITLLSRSTTGVPAAAAASSAVPEKTLPTDKSIAVLPVENLSDDKGATDYFATGVQEDLITNQANVRELRVISRTASAPGEASLSEARKIVQRARQVLDAGDELNSESYFLAEDLLKRAIELDPAEPSAWALHATLSYQLIWHSLDDSPKRLEAMRRQAERAHMLAPEATEVQIAWANARIALRQDLAGTERDLQALAAREPANAGVQRALGTLHRFLGRREDAHRAFSRARALAPASTSADADLVNALLRSHQHAQAEAVLGEALGRQASGRLLTFDLIIRTQWRGDLRGAGAALAAWPDWLRAEDRGAVLAWRALYWARQYDKALEVARRIPRDYLRDTFYSGPRAVLTARAHEAAGHAEAARDDWRRVVERADRELSTAPASPAAAYWKAWALARLGDTTAAQAVCAQMQQRGQLSYREVPSSDQLAVATYFQSPGAAPLWATVGRPDLALAELAAPPVVNDLLAVTRAILELDPAFDSLRADRQFQELLSRASAPEETRGTAATIEPRSVVVLPFVNLSSDPENEYFSDALADELLTTLQKIPGIRVAARTSAWSFKGRGSTAREVGEKLGMAHVVEGTVQKSGPRVRITARMSRAATNEEVWSQVYGPLEVNDVFATQEELARAIVGELRGRLGTAATAGHQAEIRAQVRAAQRGGTTNSAAWEAYQRGRFFYAQTSAEGVERAVGFYKDAVQIDPTFATAWTALARARLWQGSFVAVDPEFYRDAERAVEQALKWSPDLAEAHSVQSQLMQRHRFDWRAAREASARAVQMARDNAEVLTDALCVAVIFGEWERGLGAGRQAVALDPLNPETRIFLALSLFYAGQLSEAESEIRQAIALAPAVHWARLLACQILIAQGRAEEALVEAQKEPARIHRLEALALAEYARGRKTESDAALRALEVECADQWPFQIAEVYAQRGDADAAFRWLEHAWKVRESGVSLIRTAYTLRNLHADPRWPELLRRLGLISEEFPWRG